MSRMMATNLASRVILGALTMFMQLRQENQKLQEELTELRQRHIFLLDSVEQFNLAQDSLAQASKSLAETVNNHS